MRRQGRRPGIYRTWFDFVLMAGFALGFVISLILLIMVVTIAVQERRTPPPRVDLPADTAARCT